MVYFLGIALVTIVVLLFSLANLHIVELNTVFGEEVRASLAFLLLGSFVVGFTIATLVSTYRSLSLRKLRHDRATMQTDAESESTRLPSPPHIQLPVPQQTTRKAGLLGRWR